jgi:hypothetical protein
MQPLLEFRTINDESEEFKPPIVLSDEYLSFIAKAIHTLITGKRGGE